MYCRSCRKWFPNNILFCDICGKPLVKDLDIYGENFFNGDVQAFDYIYQNSYNWVAGEGHFIHTYQCDGDPLPSFEGEPKLVAIPDDMKAFTDMLWNSLNEDNKVSLFVRYIDIATGEAESVIVNKNK